MRSAMETNICLVHIHSPVCINPELWSADATLSQLTTYRGRSLVCAAVVTSLKDAALSLSCFQNHL